MPNVMPIGTNFPRRINMYVPAMQYAMDVSINGACRVNFGAPAAASATRILNAQTIGTLATIDISSVTPFPEPFGRNVSAIAAAAAATTITVNGWDYLHQPVSETITLNGTTAVPGVKAFKDFNNMVINGTVATTINLGSGARLGLPYKSIRAAYEIAAGVTAAAGTLTAGALTDPQTATSLDPRGLYTPTTAFDGTTIISAVIDFVNDVNTSNNGGLHGIKQFAA